jgi:SAM-dependent methyltransferase
VTRNIEETRFDFGRNWKRFVRRNFTPERCDIAKSRILEFAGLDSLQGVDFLDVGCGSGLHSLAAYEAGARRICSFDYDPNSVAACNMLRRKVGSPASWRVERGDVLNDDYIATLGKWDFVYCWGVLHHTGDVWRAIRNTQRTVANGGQLYLALYSADADFQPSKEFWIEVKKEYNSADPLRRWLMMWWYVWAFYLYKDPKKIPEFLHRAATYKMKRGMNIFADIRDWLGGWPMEYVADQAVIDLLERDHGFQKINLATGQACTEFLFRRSDTPAETNIGTELIAANRS